VATKEPLILQQAPKAYSRGVVETDHNAENGQRTLAELLERAVVDVLAPVTSTAGQIMHRVEDWLESRSPQRLGPSLPDQFDLTRGRQLASDLAQGMLTGELLEDSPGAGEESVSTPCSDPDTAQCDTKNLHSQ
jgi:hypothetical protein